MGLCCVGRAAPDSPVLYDPPTGQFPVLPMTLPRTLEAVKAMPVDEPAIFICSYPKSGTTWLQFILYTLCTRGQKELDHISNYCPFLENDKSWQFDDGGAGKVAERFAAAHRAIGWRIFNTHLWWEMLPKGLGARYIYVVREAKDVAYSFFAHMSHQEPSDGGFTGSFAEFFTAWCEGTIAFGHWTDHLNSYLQDTIDGLDAAARDPRILVLSYDDMKRDIGSVVHKILVHCCINISESQLKACLPRFDFSYMKQHNTKFEPKSVRWVDKGDGFQFVRKGSSGDGQKELTAKQRKTFDAMLQKGFPNGIPLVVRDFCT